MNRKHNTVAALATSLAMVAGVCEASAKAPDTAEVACKKAVLWVSPEAGPNSVSAPTKYDVVYRLQGGSNTSIGPRNNGSSDAFICNTTDKSGSYDISGASTNSMRPHTCDFLHNIAGLTVKGGNDWSACVWVRYRD